MADAAVGDRGAAGKLWLRERTVDRGDERRASAGTDVAEKPLQDPEAGVAGKLQRDPILADVDGAGDAQARVFADQLQLVDAQLLPVERHLDRRRVANLEVEQPHLHRVDRGVDEQMIWIRE